MATKVAVNRLLVTTKKLTTVNRYPALHPRYISFLEKLHPFCKPERCAWNQRGRSRGALRLPLRVSDCPPTRHLTRSGKRNAPRFPFVFATQGLADLVCLCDAGPSRPLSAFATQDLLGPCPPRRHGAAQPSSRQSGTCPTPTCLCATGLRRSET